MTARIQDIPRTGERQLHELPDFFARHGHRRFYATEKLDGFSFSFGRLDGRFVASTRERMIEPGEPTVFGRAIAGFDLESLQLPEGVILQAELCGPKIRGNKLNLAGLRLFVFDVKTPGGYLGRDAIESICSVAGLETVPLLGRSLRLDAQNVITFAAQTSTLYADSEREGAVFRAEDGAYDPDYGRVSFKVFNPAFPHAA